MLTSQDITEYSNSNHLQERFSFEGPHNIKLTYYLSVDHNEGYFFSSNGVSLQVNVETVIKDNKTKFKHTTIIAYKDRQLWTQNNTFNKKEKLNNYIQNFFLFYLKPCQLEKAIDFLSELDMINPTFVKETSCDFVVSYQTQKSGEKNIEQPFYLDKEGLYTFDYELQEKLKNFSKLLQIYTGWFEPDFFRSLDKNIVYISLSGFAVKTEYIFNLNTLEYKIVGSTSTFKESFYEYLKTCEEEGKLEEDFEYFIKRTFISFVSREKSIEFLGITQEKAANKRELTREEIDLVEMLLVN